jgi:hypothetical protein
VTESVPWGHVCGYPTERGDLYGGAHYSPACSATMTLQGRAVQRAAQQFGNGKTLPFTPCKKGYIPIHSGTNDIMYACRLHTEARRRRLLAENNKFRPGEVDLNVFWSKLDDSPGPSPNKQRTNLPTTDSLESRADREPRECK